MKGTYYRVLPLLWLVTVGVGWCQSGPPNVELTARGVAWIEKRGFPLTTYDGQNEAVNHQLAEAARYRLQSVRYWQYGGSAAFVGGAALTVGAIVSVGRAIQQGGSPQSNGTLVVGVVLTYGGSLAALGGGIWKKARARRRVRRALELYSLQ